MLTREGLGYLQQKQAIFALFFRLVSFFHGGLFLLNVVIFFTVPFLERSKRWSVVIMVVVVLQSPYIFDSPSFSLLKVGVKSGKWKRGT